MNLINMDELQDNCLIICPNNIKKQLIKEQMSKCPFKEIKYMSKKELTNEVYFTYDLNAILYINREYGYNYSLAEEILNNLKGIKKGTEKLNKLYEIYLKLKENKLLKTNPYIREFLKNKKIYIFKYSHKDLELINILETLTLDYQFLLENNTIYNHDVYKFNNINDEVRFMFSKIFELIESGVSLNQIYLYKLPSEYKLIINKYLEYHNLVLEGFNNLYLYDSKIYKKYIKHLETNTLDGAYEILRAEVNYDPFDVLSSIVDIIVKISNIKLVKEEQIKVLNFLSKNKKIKDFKYNECLKICDAKTLINDNDYVFMFGFSQGIYPVTLKDIELYSDDEKEIMGKNSTTVLNEINKEELTDFIKTTKNLMISFKEKMDKTVYYPSVLISELNLTSIIPNISNKRYSEKLTKYEIGTYYDDEMKYGIKNKYLATFSKEELKYGIFNNKFKEFSLGGENEELKLSYTKINEYNNCPFKYYLKSVLNINDYEDSFNLNLGILFHEILEDSNDSEIDLKDYDEFIKEKFSTPSNNHFFLKEIKQVFDVIAKNQSFLENTLYNKVLVEEKFSFNIDEKTIFEGKIDKVMIDASGGNLIIVDYKTGKLKFNQRKVEYGIDLQLPVYTLIAKYKYSDLSCDGIFIQNICQKDIDEDMNKNYLLEGIFNSDYQKLKRLDTELGTKQNDNGEDVNESSYIAGLSLKKDKNFKKTNLLLSKDEINQLIDATLKIIKENIKDIRDNKFAISPVYFTDRDNACLYCNFKDICFRKKEDYRIINFEEGESNGN